jgi:hypothetical protein
VPDNFILAESSIIYQGVCGTLARKVGKDVADQARKELNLMIHPSFLVNCDKTFCVSAYPLCAEYKVYPIDAGLVNLTSILYKPYINRNPKVNNPNLQENTLVLQ